MPILMTLTRLTYAFDFKYPARSWHYEIPVFSGNLVKKNKKQETGMAHIIIRMKILLTL